jgi:flagellar hook-length control protein FliK
MNLPKLANSEPVKPSRRPILSPEALQGASQAPLSGQKRVEPPAPIAAKMHAKGDNQETVARTAAKVAPPDLPPVKLDMAPARPDVTQFGQSSTPIPALLQPHRIAATPSAPHVASPLEHGHNALPKGFSTTLAHSVLDSGHSRAELILEPAELGRLRFDLVTQGDQVQVILAAERPDTLDLLRRHVDELRQEFRNSGLDTGTLSFGQWGKGGDGRALPDQPGLDNVSQNPRPLIPVTLPATRLSAPGSGLDLRL